MGYQPAALICFIVAFVASGSAAVFSYVKDYANTAFLFTFLAVVSIVAFAYYGIR